MIFKVWTIHFIIFIYLFYLLESPGEIERLCEIVNLDCSQETVDEDEDLGEVVTLDDTISSEDGKKVETDSQSDIVILEENPGRFEIRIIIIIFF